MTNSSNDFSAAIEAAFTMLERVGKDVSLLIDNDKQFYIVVPDGALPERPPLGIYLSYLKSPTDGVTAVLLARLLFLETGGMLVDRYSKEKYCISFSNGMQFRDRQLPPAVSMTAVVGGLWENIDGKSNEDGIPDIGDLLENIKKTRNNIELMDYLLKDNSIFLTEDNNKRILLNNKLSSIRDKALDGLEQLGRIVSEDGQSPGEWRARVAVATSQIIEAMSGVDGLTEDINEEKRNSLMQLQDSVLSYFNTLSPDTDMAEAKAFSQCINNVVISEKKAGLHSKKDKLNKELEGRYEDVLREMRRLLGNTNDLINLQNPFIEKSEECAGKITLQMTHVIRTVCYGGLSIKLETDPSKRGIRFRGWSGRDRPRINIIERRNVSNMMYSRMLT